MAALKVLSLMALRVPLMWALMLTAEDRLPRLAAFKDARIGILPAVQQQEAFLGPARAKTVLMNRRSLHSRDENDH